MKKIIFPLCLFLFSCGKVENSATLDKYIYQSGSTCTGSASFCSMRSPIYSKCMSCHTHGAWASYNEQDFITAGLVVAGDSTNSKLYYRNANATSGPGPKNMPSSGSALTSAELDLLTAWISGL